MVLEGNWWDSTGAVGTGAAPAPSVTAPSAPIPGRFDFNPLSPAGAAESLQKDQQATDDLLNGVGQALFGVNNNSLASHIPVIGDPLTHFVQGVADFGPVSVAAGVVKNLAGAGHDILTHIPTGWLPGGVDETWASLPQQAAAAGLPFDPKAYAAVEQAAANDPLGAGDLKFRFIQQTFENSPELSAKLGHGPAGSLGGLADQALSLLGLPQRFVERGIAGSNFGGGNRLDQIAQLAQTSPKDLTPVEAATLQKFNSGEWSQNQALDFLSSHGAGLSHDQLTEIIGTFATDPLVLASAGAGALDKLGAVGRTVEESGAIGRLSPLERIGQGVYGIQQGDLQQAFHIARTIIDPLGAISHRTPAGEAAVDLTGDAAVAMVHEAYGPFATKNVYGLEDQFPGISQQLADAAGMYGSNAAREILGKKAAGELAAQQFGRDIAISEDGVNVPLSTVDELIGKVAKQDISSIFVPELQRVAKFVWSDADRAALAGDLARSFGYDETAVGDAIAGFGKSELGFLHALLYSHEQADFLATLEKGAPEFAASGKKLPYGRLNMMNEGTLTDIGARGILDGLKGPTEEAFARLQELAPKYPFLRQFVLRETDKAGSIDKVRKALDSALARDILNHQITDSELSRLPQVLKDWVEAHPNRTLGFTPPDDLKWNFTQNADGIWEVTNPWVDHVAAGVQFRPTLPFRFNIAGMPLAHIVGKPVDWLDSGLQVLRRGVGNVAVQENATQRFIADGVERGLSEGEARQMIREVQQAAGLNKTSVRSLLTTQMWDVLAGGEVIPLGRLARAGIGPREFAHMVVQAYEGDLRIVGLTQKFTGSLKTFLQAHAVGSNMVGHIAESVYPLLKFGLNVAMQAWNRLDPFIFSPMRGVLPVLREGATEQRVGQVYRALYDTSLMAKAAPDIREWRSIAAFSEQSQNGLRDLGSRLENLKNAPRLQRINMLKVVYANLGGRVRRMFEDSGRLEDWVAFKQNYAAQLGHVVDDNEAALHYLEEKTAAVLDTINPDGTVANFESMLREKDWYAPTDLGQLQPLRLGSMADYLGFGSNRAGETSLAALRRQIRSGKTSLADLADRLDAAGAPADYIRRVQNALDFNWSDFWKEMGGRFGVEDTRSLQRMMEAAARDRGMNPTEFMSQVFAPHTAGGKDALINALADHVNVLRAPAKGGTPEMLTSQMADVFFHHLDPSAQKTMLLSKTFDGAVSKVIDRSMRAGRTEESQALQRGLENLRGGWDQASADAFASAVLARARTGEAVADPAVETMYRQFSKWAKDVFSAGLEEGGGKPNPWSQALTDLARIPTEGAKPYDVTEQALVSSIFDAFRYAADDAYKLAYYNRTRTVLERSINHPFFGLYPASYMWGHVAPELFKFVAQTPFGIHTGAAAMALNDVQEAMAIQQEFDPKFDAKLTAIGRNQALFLLGYMLPTLPWELPANAPIWLRDIAKQGLANQRSAQAGGTGQPIDLLGKPLTDTVSQFNPLNKLSLVTQGVGAAAQAVAPSTQTIGGVTYGALQGAQQEEQGPLSDALNALTGLFGGGQSPTTP